MLAHTVTGLPYVVLTVSASLSNLDPRLEQAARGLGASIGQTLRYVIVPNIIPGVLSGAIFAFIHSWDELVVVIFIGGRALFTLPRRMWDGINDNLDPVIAVVATGMILFTLLVLTAELSLRARRALGVGMSDIRDRLDDIEQFIERTEGKVYPRRVFMGMAAAMGLAPIAAKLTPALADAKELVVVNWGGDAVKGMQRSWVDPYPQEVPRPEGDDRRHRPLDQPHPHDGRQQEGQLGRDGPQPAHRARDRAAGHARADRLFDRRQEQGAARARRRMGHRQLHLCRWC